MVEWIAGWTELYGGLFWNKAKQRKKNLSNVVFDKLEVTVFETGEIWNFFQSEKGAGVVLTKYYLQNLFHWQSCLLVFVYKSVMCLGIIITKIVNYFCFQKNNQK